MKKTLIYFLILCFGLSLTSCKKEIIEADGPEVFFPVTYDTVEELVSVLQEDPNVYGDILVPRMIPQDGFDLEIQNSEDSVLFKYTTTDPEKQNLYPKPGISVSVRKNMRMSFDEIYESNPRGYRVVEDGVICDGSYYKSWYYDMGDTWILVAPHPDIEWNGWASLNNYFTFETLDFPEREYEEEGDPWISIGVIAAVAVVAVVPTTLLILRAKRRRAKNN